MGYTDGTHESIFRASVTVVRGRPCIREAVRVVLERMEGVDALVPPLDPRNELVRVKPRFRLHPQIGTSFFYIFHSAFPRRAPCLPWFLLVDTAVIAMRCRSGAFSRSGGEEALDTTHQDEDMEFDVRWDLLQQQQQPDVNSARASHTSVWALPLSNFVAVRMVDGVMLDHGGFAGRNLFRRQNDLALR